MDLVDTLKARGLFKQCTDEAALRALLASGPVTVYAGFDPTADSMHVGHLVPVMALAWMQRFGHRPIVVLGGGTAMVGDQLFADIAAARLAGLTAILVRPIHPEEEHWFTRIKRPPEKLLLRWMKE